MLKLDRRRGYYLVLDCETATLPFAGEYDGKARKNIAIAKPLIYDLGWQIVDRQGRVYQRKNFLITEIFSVPSIFNTAYYASKRPLYLEMLRKGEIVLADWRSATAELMEALEAVEAVGAYNSMFDFKKAIPFMELYINKLYSPDLQDWLDYQHGICDRLADGEKYENTRDFDGENFRFRGRAYPLFDIWGLSCKYLLNNDDFREWCYHNNAITESGKYFKTSAENAYRYLFNEADFDEAHTALDDATIESEILRLIMKPKKSNLEIGLIYFPFRLIGRVE